MNHGNINHETPTIEAWLLVVEYGTDRAGPGMGTKAYAESRDSG